MQATATDPFEARFMKGVGRVFFRDKIPMMRFILAPFAALLAFAAWAVVVSPFWAMRVLFLLFFALILYRLLTSFGVRTMVSEGGLEVFVGIRRYHIALDDIAQVECATFSKRQYPLGRGHVHRGRHGKAIVGTPGFDQPGVMLTLADGSTRFVETTKPAALERALGAAKAGRQSDKLRIANPEYAARLVEAEAEVEALLEHEATAPRAAQ